MPNKEDEESVVAIANPIDIKAQVPVCYSTNTHTHTHTGRLLFTVLGAFVDAIGK
jgi:hypothetical protein